MNFPKHRFYEDVLALFYSSILVSFGLILFGTNNILTGGTAGITLIGTHFIDINFGLLFFLVNVPFYYLAWTQLSKRLALNTFIAVTLVSVITEQMQHLINIESTHPIFASVIGGILMGMGLLILFRHQSSLGGLSILALYLQKKYNIRAGNFCLSVDCIILVLSSFIFSFDLVILSIIGAMALNLVITVNHKPGRYQASVKSKQVKKEKNIATVEEKLVNMTD